MWIPQYIKLTNFISFKEQTFEFRNNEAILIQGRNADDQSQKSNGVGKSALIEAVAVAFSGTSIRDVLTKDLIFNGEKSGEVEIYLTNPTINKTLKIYRKIYANTKSAECRIWINDVEKTDLPDVNSYNKYVFEMLGISKEDFFNFYLITDENGFVPFLKASDTKKKEIINRFSGADKVDIAIPFIEQDSLAKQHEIDVLTKEIEKLQSNQELLVTQTMQEEEKLNPDTINELVGGYKDKIFQHKISISSHEDTIFVVNGKKVEKEKELADFVPTDFDTDIKTNEKEKDRLVNELATLKVSLANCKDKFKDEIQGIKEREEAIIKEKTDGHSALNLKEKDIANVKKGKLEALKIREDNLSKEKRETRESINEYETFIAEINKHLAGTIECPKCSHKFLLQDKAYNIDEACENKVTAEGELAGLQLHLTTHFPALEKEFEEEKQVINKEASDEQKKIDQEKQIISATALEKEKVIDLDKQEVNKKVLAEQEKVKGEIYQNALDTTEVDKKLISVYNLKKEEENKVKSLKNEITQFQLSVEREQASITNINTQIESIQRQIDLHLNIDRSKIEQLEAQTLELIEKEEVLNDKLQVLTEEKKSIDAWALNFKMFKSHLANKSLANVQSYTNLYLKEMGSNISIEIEGYRMMANKKLKEEISTIVLKDGFAVGSYGKFSKGEKARIDICNVLANQSLIDLNSPTGGVNMLLVDEVCDSVDEEGLFNIVNACQTLNRCIMIVSQNTVNIVGHTIVIQKENKVSKILV